MFSPDGCCLGRVRNPAPVAMADGTVHLMVHTDPAPWAGELIAVAPTFRGPYTYVGAQRRCPTLPVSFPAD
jgi:hypothetical protein